MIKAIDELFQENKILKSKLENIEKLCDDYTKTHCLSNELGLIQKIKEMLK